MANKQKTERVTIANFIAIVGLVLLLVFTYIGHSYMSGGEVGWDIITSVAITGISAFLLWFLIKAKGAENQLDKWRMIEYATLAAYIVIAIPASLFGGIMHFFVVNDNKDEIKQYAMADLSQIDNLFREYVGFEEAAISRTGNGLYKALGQPGIPDEDLRFFIADRHIDASNRESAKTFEELQRDHLLGSGYKHFHENYLNQKVKIESVVKSWSILQIPMKAKLIEELSENVESELTKLSHSAKLPNIDWDHGRYVILEDNQCRDFKIDNKGKVFQFSKALKSASGFSFTAIFIVLFIHLLILFNYIVAYRTRTLGISKHQEEDGGIILK